MVTPSYNPSQVVRSGEVPPPSTVGCSCVYILRRSDGRFYCGQTDELRGRLNRHRKVLPVKGGASMEAAYLIVPSEGQGQSTARAVEAQVIQVSVSHLASIATPMTQLLTPLVSNVCCMGGKPHFSVGKK